MKFNKQCAHAWLGGLWLLAVSAALVSAQGKPAARPTGLKPPPAVAPPNTTPVSTPVAPEYLSGQAEVSVRGNQDPPIRLGLAQNGVTVVEFPAADRFFAVHPGGSKIVVVDESPTLATDHYLVFRAGPDFAAPLPGTKRPAAPEATVSVQMQSGLFLTFLFYPVAEVAQMAHRCTVLYARNEVVATRRAAGLAVNLDAPETAPPAGPIASQRFAAAATTPGPAAGGPAVMTTESEDLPPAGRGPARAHGDFAAATRRALQSALAAPGQFARWGAARHGLALAVAPPLALDAQHSLALVAVRNTGRTGLRLLEGQPALALATLDERGQTQHTQALPALYTGATANSGDIPAGATVYYAVVYATPVLDAGQRLRWTAAQSQAADEPATAAVDKQ
jgi:hypothetical protein